VTLVKIKLPKELNKAKMNNKYTSDTWTLLKLMTSHGMKVSQHSFTYVQEGVTPPALPTMLFSSFCCLSQFLHIGDTTFPFLLLAIMVFSSLLQKGLPDSHYSGHVW